MENSLLDESFFIEIKEPKVIDIRRVKWTSYFAFEVYGVKVGIRSNNKELIENIEQKIPYLIPVEMKVIDFDSAEHIFSFYISKRSKKQNAAFKNGEKIISWNFGVDDIDALESQIRITVAEFAENYIFLHAGVVEYKGRAILIPGKSFSGKTTLVAELVKRGMPYYSDEYAVIDKDGFIYPFSKKLSVRGIIDDYKQVDIDVEELGGRKGFDKLEIGIILVSKYKKKAKFQIEEITAGAGMIETIANSVSIRQNPEFVLKILSLITNQAKIFRTTRGEVQKFVDKFLIYLEALNF